ncbi:MAG: hypothetical protein KGO02_07315, partial [Alphaproteobacteria bacterium]|nr:hypothetical protein [Alphaproteobacteria bacterium]
FGVVAVQLGLSKSAFLKRLVELNLQSAAAAAVTVPERPPNPVCGTRLSVRLRLADCQLLGACRAGDSC